MKREFRIKERDKGYAVEMKVFFLWLTIKKYKSDERLFAEELIDYLYEA